jgi:hypothetical protein
MSHFVTKKVVLSAVALGILILLVGGCEVSPYGLLPFLPTATPQCVFEQWYTKELPELSLEWQKQLGKMGIQITNAQAIAVGETIRCGVQTLGGWSWYDGGETISDVVLEVGIPVSSVADDVLLGASLAKVLEAVESIPTDKSIKPTRYLSVHVIFTANTNKELRFDMGYIMLLREQGLSMTELFMTLDGRYNKATPTIEQH